MTDFKKGDRVRFKTGGALGMVGEVTETGVYVEFMDVDSGAWYSPDDIEPAPLIIVIEKGTPVSRFNEDMTNADRANRAEIVLREYEETEELQTVMSDFLCDLRHLADFYALDWDDLLGHGDLHYFAEVKEEKENSDG